MNPDDLFGAPSPDDTEEGLKEAKDKAESKDKLYDEVDNLDRQAQERQEPVVEAQEKGPWQTFRDRARQLNEIEVDSEVQGIATDPSSTLQYIAAPPAGVLDTAIGMFNMAMPGNAMDIPNLPKFQNEGAQFARDLSSILIPGMGMGRALTTGGKALAASRSGRLGAFLKDPLVAWSGTQAASIGGGALADLAAPVQGETGSQTLIGTVKESFPRWTGWLPDNLVVLDKDSPDVIRQKNLLEGGMFGATASLIEGVGKLARGLKGMTEATTYVPKNEKAGNYFKNQAPEPETVEEVVDASTAKMNVDRSELGQYNEMKAAERGDLSDESIIFGRDDILFSPAENGIRSVDDQGVVGGMVDLARIQDNIDTVYGRVRNPMSEGALKYSLTDTGVVPDVMQQLGKQIDDAGDFDVVLPTGKKVTNEQIKEATDNLVSQMLDVDRNTLEEIMGNFVKGSKAGPVYKDKTAAGIVKRVINEQLGKLADMNVMRAYAVTQTSFAGQAADFAQQMRLNEGTEGFIRAQEEMLDKLEFLMDIDGATKYAQNTMIRANNAFQRLTGVTKKTSGEKYAEMIQQQMKTTDNPLEVMELIQADTRQMMQSLRQLSAERPMFLKPMAMLYEMTDGDARSVSYLNNYLRQSTGVIRKAFIDGQPEIPSVVMQGFWSTAFNSALSGLKTPFKAGVGNISTFIFKPASHVIGAFLQGDTKELTRAFYAYGNVLETMNNALGYSKNFWTKSAQDPYLMRGRDELVYKSQEQMDLFKATADAAMAEGNNGPAMLYDIMKQQQDMAEHPLLRVGNRSMGTQDAWLQSINGQFQSRLRAYDTVTANGTKEFTQESADELSRTVYKDMFDEKGIIRDQQVLNDTARQAFSQDNAISTGFQDMMQRIPGLKPFFMFTRTPVNSLSYGAQFAPVGAFIDRVKRFDLPFEQQDFNKVKRLLTDEGVDIANVDVRAEYTRLRNTYKGNAAIGTGLVSAAVFAFLGGGLTGRAGLMDNGKQKLRRDAGWKPMTINGIYYGDIPAVSDWLSLTADIMDNFTSMESYDMSEMIRAMGFIIGANLTERTQLQNIEQFSDVLRGNPAAIQRWAANTTFTATSKVGGMLGSLNQLISPQLKAVENKFFEMYANRIPGKPGLTDRYDYIDGGKVNELGNPLHRIYNAISPIAYHEKVSDVKEYLKTVEFDGTPTLSVSGLTGVKYTKAEMQEVLRIMGEKGTYRNAVKEIMKDYPAESIRTKFERMRGKGNVSVKDLDMLHNELDMALQDAKMEAEEELPMELYDRKVAEFEAQEDEKELVKDGDVEGFLENMQNISY